MSVNIEVLLRPVLRVILSDDMECSEQFSTKETAAPVGDIINGLNVQNPFRF